jgi:predicted RNase H-like HicB family nuclease
MAIYYPAVIEASSDGFHVFFPDVAGCTSFGATMQEAVRNAEEGLNSHLELLIEGGSVAPEASDIDKVQVDDDIEEAGRVLIRADLPGKSVRITLTIDEALLERADRLANERGFTRSGYIAQLMRDDLDRAEHMTPATDDDIDAAFKMAMGGGDVSENNMNRLKDIVSRSTGSTIVALGPTYLMQRSAKTGEFVPVNERGKTKEVVGRRATLDAFRRKQK